MSKSVKINASILFDGWNEPMKDGSVIFEGSKITYAGTSEGSPKADTQYSTQTVMPGLWDCHIHYFGVKGASEAEWNLTHPITMSARAIFDAQADLRAGFTSVREVGGIGLKMREAIDDGTSIGPKIYSAGSPIGITAGHADAHTYPLDFVRSRAALLWGSLGPVDGPWEAVKAMRVQFREGADLIKIMGSGGVMSQRDSPHHQEFSDEELEAMVNEAQTKERVIASHTHGAAGIKAVLKAGIQTIEHGTWLDDELCDLMIEKDAILVPTIFIQQRLKEFGEQFGASTAVMDKIQEVAEKHKETMKLAYKKGVQIACGTDIYSSGMDSMVPHGMNAKELSYYVEVGMSPLEALRTATAMGPKTLGPRAPKSGELKVGYDADIVCLSTDPFRDITSIEDRKNIIGVFKMGNLDVNNGIV